MDFCWERAGLLVCRQCSVFFIQSCLCSFPLWCLGNYVEFDCIGSWSLPFHLLCKRSWSNRIERNTSKLPPWNDMYTYVSTCTWRACKHNWGQSRDGTKPICSKTAIVLTNFVAETMGDHMKNIKIKSQSFWWNKDEGSLLIAVYNLYTYICIMSNAFNQF